VVGKKNPQDQLVEDRIRAHLRQRMERRKMGVTATAKLLGIDQGNLTKILQRTRGITAGVVYRICQKFSIDADVLFNVDPEPNFWRHYVPRAPDDPGTASAAHLPNRRGAQTGGPPAKE
jgi:plasmid maintenance system antidote protein VapI